MAAIWGLPKAWRHAFTRTSATHLGVCGLLAWLACALSAHAQTLPDAGAIQREIERQQPMRPPATAPQAPPVMPAAEPRPDEMQFQIKAFALQGVTLLQQSEVQAVLQPWLGRPIQFSDLERAKQAIADLYQSQGWFARPQIPEQELQDDGEITLHVIEGRLGAVRTEHEALAPEAAQRIDRERIVRTFTARQQVGEHLYMPHIERAISLLNDTPGMGVSATLATGDAPAASDIVVTPMARSLFSGSATLDNAGSRSTGAQKATVAMSLDNPAGWGDQTALNLMASEGVRYGRVAYSLPLGYDGVRLGLNASSMRYHVIFPMSESNPSYPRGTADTQGLSLSWPALRSGANNIYLSGTLDQKHFVNEIYNPDTANINQLSNKRLGVGGVSASGDHSDAWGEGGMTQWSLGWVRGHVNLWANLQNQQQDQQGPGTQGHYEKFSVSLSRLQRLSASHTLWLSLQGQRSDKNLDSSEKFSLGGAQGVRGFPSAEGSGDHGWLATLESRRLLSAQWQWTLFYDHGQITVNHRPYVGANGPSHVALRSWGTSLNYTQPGLGVARLSWARRIHTSPLANEKTGLDGDGSLLRNRFWFSVTAFF